MTITAQQFADWLDDPAARRATIYKLNCVSGGVPVVRMVSNAVILNNPSDNPCLAIVAQDLEVSASISMSGDPQISTGQIVLTNTDGELDSWFDDVWVNQRVDVMVGDVTWPIGDFQTQYVGYLADIYPGSTRFESLLKFRDTFQRLNTPVSDVKMSDGSLKPVAFGEIPNLTPKYDAATGRYYYHTGAAEGLVEPRTDGKKRLVPSEITDYPATGCMGFNVAVGGGAVTCSVQGDKTGGIYRTAISDIVQILATAYGKPSTRMTSADMDATNLAAFKSANPQPVGLAILERMNVLEACARLASSKGAQVLPSRLGALRLVQYAMPTVADFDIPLSIQDTAGGACVTMTERTTPRGAVKIAYCRNYTVQDSLQTSIPSEHKQMFAQEWRTYTEIDQATIDKYQLSTDPEQEETCLLTRADAIDEAKRRLAIVKVPRGVFRVPLLPPGMLLEVGKGGRLYGSGYGLEAGKIGLITKLTINYGTYRAVAEITI